MFPRVDRGQTEIVVEYWCYYVYNEFTVRGTWLPYRVQDDHPHDLERLYLVLTPTGAAPGRRRADEAWARGAFRIRSVVANAHDGSIPPNQYDVPAMASADAAAHHARRARLARDGARHQPRRPVHPRHRQHRCAASCSGASATPARPGAAIAPRSWTAATRRRCVCAVPQTRVESRRICARVMPCIPLTTCNPGFRASICRPATARTSSGGPVAGSHVRRCADRDADGADGSAGRQRAGRDGARRTRGQAGFLMGLSAAAHPGAHRRPAYFWNVGPRRAPDIAAEVVALFPSATVPSSKPRSGARTRSTPSPTSSSAAAGSRSVMSPTSRPAPTSGSDVSRYVPPGACANGRSIRA